MAKIVKIISDIVFVLLIFLLCMYFALRLMGITEIFKVKTGSMEDGIHAGDYILIYKKNKYNVGDVVTYEKDNYHVTHRIIKKSGENVVTKGDANNIEDDEINSNSIVGKVIYSGGYLNIIIDYKYAIASFLLALYLFSCYFSKKDDKDELVGEKMQEEEFLSKDSIEDDTTEDNISSEEDIDDDKGSNISLEENINEDNENDISSDEENVLVEEKEDEKLKQDLSFIYENKVKNKKKTTKNKRKRKNKK